MSNWKRAALLIFALALVEYGVAEKLAPLCNDRGVIRVAKNVTSCACNNGFYGDFCQDTVGTLAPEGWTATRVILCCAYGAILILTSVMLYQSVRERRDSSAEDLASSGLFRAKTMILVLVILICVFTLLNWAVDPNGGEYVYPFLLYRYIFGIVFPLFTTLFGTVLFHWKNIYDISVATIKRELMLEQIKPDYEPQVSLDVILQQSNIFRRSSYLFVGLNVAAWVFQFVRETLMGLGAVTTKGPLQPIWMAFFCALFFSEAIGIIVYGIKLKSIMPEVVLKRLAPVTHKVMGIAVTFVCMWILAIVLLTGSRTPPGPDRYIAVELVVRFAFAIDLLAILTLFFRFSSKFPFIYRGNTSAETPADTTATVEMSTDADPDAEGGISV